MAIPFTPRPVAGNKPNFPKRRLIDKLIDAVKITAVILLSMAAAGFGVRQLGFNIGVNICALGLFFLAMAIVFVKSSRFAEDAVVIAGATVSFIGLFAFVPVALMWEYWGVVGLGVLVVFVEVARFVKAALKEGEKTVSNLAEKAGEIFGHHASPTAPQIVKRTARIPKGPVDWLVSVLLGVIVFLIANIVRIYCFAHMAPYNILFTATSLIGLGTLGMIGVAFSRANNAAEDAMAGLSVAVAWTGIFLSWPHPAWHVILLLAVMSVVAGGTIGPKLRWLVMAWQNAAQKPATSHLTTTDDTE